MSASAQRGPPIGWRPSTTSNLSRRTRVSERSEGSRLSEETSRRRSSGGGWGEGGASSMRRSVALTTPVKKKAPRGGPSAFSAGCEHAAVMCPQSSNATPRRQ